MSFNFLLAKLEKVATLRWFSDKGIVAKNPVKMKTWLDLEGICLNSPAVRHSLLLWIGRLSFVKVWMCCKTYSIISPRKQKSGETDAERQSGFANANMIKRYNCSHLSCAFILKKSKISESSIVVVRNGRPDNGMYSVSAFWSWFKFLLWSVISAGASVHSPGKWG